MTKATKKNRKTEPLSLRLDPKDKFILDYLVKITGMGITTVVERAIREYAVSIGDQTSFPPWRNFWNVSEGIRKLMILHDKELPTTYEEDELIEFIEKHHEFFYFEGQINIKDDPIFNADQVNVLWPNIYDYLEIWRETKVSDPNSAKEAMVKALKTAGRDEPV